MRPPLQKVLTLALAAGLVLQAAQTASARVKKHRTERPVVSMTIQTCNGTPIIMQGLECRTAPARSYSRRNERVGRLPVIPRGSGGPYVPTPLPRTPSLASQPSPTPYTPPPINSFSDRVMQCNQSFTFNAGIGNNPVGRDAYVRQCAN
jgi:hypothetical protein